MQKIDRKKLLILFEGILNVFFSRSSQVQKKTGWNFFSWTVRTFWRIPKKNHEKNFLENFVKKKWKNFFLKQLKNFEN